MSLERTWKETIPYSRVEDAVAAILYQVAKVHDNEDVVIKFSPWDGKSDLTFSCVARSRGEVSSTILNGKSST